MQLKSLTPEGIGMAELAGEQVDATITVAPGNGAAIGGVKVVAAQGWFAARSRTGTEDIYKIYAESFRSEAHLREIQHAAQDVLARVFDVGAGLDSKEIEQHFFFAKEAEKCCHNCAPHGDGRLAWRRCASPERIFRACHVARLDAQITC